RHEWLKRRMDDFPVAECVFENLIRLLETPLQIAAPDAPRESNVGSGSSFKIFEVGEHHGRLQGLMDDRSAGLCCRDLIEHRLEWFVVHGDQIRRFFSNVWVRR